jgi:hypothetical protein
MKFALKDVLPNPYHDLVGYRYLEYKIEKLMESIRATGYGDNTVGRMLTADCLRSPRAGSFATPVSSGLRARVHRSESFKRRHDADDGA